MEVEERQKMATAAEQAEIHARWNKIVAAQNTEFLAGLSFHDRMLVARRRVDRGPIGRVLTAREGAGRFPSDDWYAVLVEPSCEQAAADSFRRKKVPAYWPSVERQEPAGKGRRRAVLSPIMPGMIFCPTVQADLSWRAIKCVRHVRGLMLKSGGERMRLTCEDVAIILQIEAEQDAQRRRPNSYASKSKKSATAPSAHTFKVGDDVRFTGDINGRWPPGRVIGLPHDGRIKLVVAGVMGCALPFLACPHQIERIESKALARTAEAP
jgi:transcription antitermination factor NusG